MKKKTYSRCHLGEMNNCDAGRGFKGGLSLGRSDLEGRRTYMESVTGRWTPLERTGGSCHIQGWCQLSTARETTVYKRSCCGGVRGSRISHNFWDRVSVIRLYVLLIGNVTDGFWEEF